MHVFHERAPERLAEMAGDERLASHALATGPPTESRTGAWRGEMSESEQAEFEGVAGALLTELGYETRGRSA
jgi:hypothetical protein